MLMSREGKMRIRKLTETECMRLMGFEDKDTQAMKGIGMSASAIYHCAGDSIVVPCLNALFSEFFNEQDKHIEIIENYVERVKE
jgi:site-specific DNA-cytosine methylase